MRTDQICVATITRARGPHEEELIHRTLTALSARGLHIVAADGGSRPSFVDALSGIANLTLVPSDHSGLVGQIKASVRAARARPARHILYLESDKEQFVTGAMDGFLSKAVQHQSAGVVLASRSPNSFATFPAFQRRVESAFNAVGSVMLGVEGDFLYGPVLMNGAVAALVDGAAPDLGWGWRPFVFGAASQRGERIIGVEGDYPCPADQVHEHDGERQHRLRQLAENLKGLVQASQHA
jgi:hypothetical protein